MADKKNAEAVARIDEIQEGELRLIERNGEEILLTKSHGEICACGNSCTHYGAPLTDGWMEDGEIVCPWHYARFDPASGERRTPPALDDLPRYETEVVGDEIFLGQKHVDEIPLPSGSDTRTILIVGGGAAGQAAAETLRREGFAGAVTIISAEEELPYDRTALSKGMLSGKADPDRLALRGAQFYERLKIDLKPGARVKQLDAAKKQLILDDGKRLSGDMILLATGSRPRRLPIPGAESAHLIRELREAKELARELSGAKRVAVIGAGFISLEAAANLRERGVEVDVIAPEKLPLERVFGAEAASRIAEIHRAQGVRFHLGTTVAGIAARDAGYELEMNDRNSLQTDLVLMAVGVEPVLDYLDKSGLEHENGIPVNERFETNAPGIFAAGDIARFPYPGIDGEPLGLTRSEHWINSQMQGVHAARAMLGAQEPFSEVPLFWSKQYGYSFKFAGYAEEYDQTVIHGSLAEDSWLAGYYRKGRLRGVSGFGKGKAIYKLRSLIGRGGNVSLEDFTAGKF